MTIYNYIGSVIKETRVKANMSQEELAKKIGYQSATAISLIETGERRVSIEALDKISKALYVDISFFLGRIICRDTIETCITADREISYADKEALMRYIYFIKNKGE